MRNHKLLIGLLALAFLLGPGQKKLSASSRDDFSKLRTQLIARYLRGAPEARRVEGYIKALRPDGSWPDIDYANKEPGSWRTQSHLTRLLAMAEAYRRPNHPLAGNAELRAAIVKGLENWTRNDYTNPNWWYMQIGAPQVMAPILILMDDAVPADLKEQAVRQVLGRSKMGMTGQNKVWVAGIAFMKGLLAHDPNLMAKAQGQILSELRITTEEGIQPDYSFYQHGPQQQWGNYGGAFGGDMIRWAGIFHGTNFALAPSQLEVLRGYLQEGPAWIVWKGRMDISGCGRQVFRNCQLSKGRSVLQQLESMKTIDPAESDTYTHLIASDGPNGTNALIGDKHFWRSDITVHRRPTWYASVKMSSTRVIGAETCNGENLLGLHLGDGVTYFYRTGTEYDDLFPVWDWRRLPGTTCRQDEGSLAPNSRACRGRSDFVGGLSDGEHGIAALDYLRGDLHARKVWFSLDDAVVCLGAGINCNAPENVLTSVNQCVLKSPVTVCTAGDTRELSKGEPVSGELKWVHHDAIGYIFLERAKATVCAQTQSGNWHRVHSRESERTVQRDVFSLWIDHGTRPRDGRYAYLVLPDAEIGAMPLLYDSPPVKVLQQTASLVAVSSQGGRLIQAAFFAPGRLAWGSGSSLEVDAPCLAALDATGDKVHLYVADPTHQRQTITLRLTWPGQQREQTEMTISLPQGGFAGRTVSRTL